MAFLETWIGLRYLRAKKRKGFVSFISAISIAGIALGVAVLILVLSVVNGFQRDIRGQLLSVAPHAEIGYQTIPAEGSTWRDLRKIVEGKKEVLGNAPYIANQALLANAGEVRGVQIRGILPEEEGKVADYVKKLPEGSVQNLKEGEFGLLLGRDLAQTLDVQVGSKVTVLTPEGNVTPAGVVPRLKQFNVVGLLETGSPDADATMALTHLADAQKLYRYDDLSVALRLRLADPQNAPEVMAKMLPEKQYPQLWVRNWTDYNRTYFDAVQIEKRMLTLLLGCIILVAVFNLVASLVMTVNEKQADIAILRTLGMSPGGIMKVFMVQGLSAGVVGTIVGALLGLLAASQASAVLAQIETWMGRKLISAGVYHIDYLPTEIRPSDVVTVILISIVLSFLATIYPSWSAARTQPAEALRYE